MPKGTKVADFSIVYKDVFSWEWLYKMIHFWLIDEGYNSPQGGDKWKEDNFVQRVAPHGKEVWVWWRTEKDSPNKYVKLKLYVEYHVLGLSDTEIMHEGNKIKVQKGEVEVFIKGFIERDTRGINQMSIFKKSPMLTNWFEKRFYQKEYKQEEARIYNDCYRLQHAVKQYFDIKGWLGEYEGKPFIPKKGF